MTWLFPVIRGVMIREQEPWTNELRETPTGEATVSSRITTAFVASIVAILPALVAGAQGVAFAVVDGPYPDATLNRLDLLSGALIPIGPIGHPTTHIAFDSTGTLYGVSINQTQLIRIDARHGLGTEVGPLGTTITDVKGLSFCNGNRLWMTATGPTSGPALFELDPTTGAATRFVDLSYEHFGSLACNDDTLILTTDSLASVDTSTGAVTPLPSSDFGIWVARATDLDDFGVFRGLMLCGPCMGPTDVLAIRTVDLSTGTFVDEGPYEPHGTWGLGIMPGGLFFDGFEFGDTDEWSRTLDHNHTATQNPGRRFKE